MTEILRTEVPRITGAIGIVDADSVPLSSSFDAADRYSFFSLVVARQQLLYAEVGSALADAARSAALAHAAQRCDRSD